ncbi:MAG: M28 family peptidase [Planctomycetota bacterium]
MRTTTVVTAVSCALGLAAALLLPGCDKPAPPNPIDGERALAHVRAMVELGPRPSGSPALYRCRDYIVGRLRELGLEPVVDKWSDDAGKPEVPSFFNVEVEIPGTRAGDPRLLVVGSHYDTKRTDGHTDPMQQGMRFVGANDAGSSSGLLLELARHFKAAPLPVTLHLVWFDGEESIPWEWDDARALFGSRRAVARLRERFPAPVRESVPVMVLLDMVGARDLHIVKDTLFSDPELVDLFAGVAAELGHEERFFRTSMPVKDDHMPFANVSIKTIDLIQFRPEDQAAWWHKDGDDLDLLSASSLATVGHVVATALPRIVDKWYPPRP